MSFLVVAVLSLLWLGFFLPSFLQSRQSSSPYASATTFQESLRRISESRPQTAGEPGGGKTSPGKSRRRPSAVAARRRDVLAGLSGLVVLSSLLAVSVQGVLMWAPIPAVAVFIGYVVVLRNRVRSARRTRRRAVVPPPPAVLVPVADDGVVPSVRRRALQDVPQPVAARASGEHLERIAG